MIWICFYILDHVILLLLISGPVCQEFGAWLHVDASYAGNAFICPEYQYLMKGIEVGFTLSINYVFINNLLSISSTINVRVFRTKFWRQKSQSRT